MGKVWRSAQHEDGARRDVARPGEARLVDGLRRRAPEALAGLHEEYAAGIYNLALRVVRHPSDAEDITQDVLIRAFERLPKDREVLLRPWLYRLTLNRCYDYLRVAARRPLAAAPELEAPSPHDLFDQSELQRLLEASLGDLTRRQRAALLLKDVHGLTLVEVGACLDLTPGSVEVLLARARRAFRASFEGRCVAAGRPVPRSAGAVVGLPLLPLPAEIGAPPLALPFAAPSPAPFVPLVPAVGAPLTAATGGGIGALLGLPASVKTAVLVAAAAASLGSAELVATRADQRPPRPEPRAAVAVAASASGVTTTVSRPREKAAPSVVGAAAKAASPSPAPLAPTAPATAAAEPSPQGSPLAIPTPAVSPDVTSSPTPDAHATTPATESPAPSPSPTVTATPSPGPSATPGPDASPSPAPSPAPSPGL